MKFILFNFLFLLSVLTITAQTLTINEVCSSNVSIIADEDGTFADWIELHNCGVAPVNLNGYRLTDNAAILAKWTIPNITIGAGQYRVIWASGKNKVNPSLPLHTNFALAAGEPVILSNPAGNIVSQVADVTMPDNYALARIPNCSGPFTLTNQPSAAVANFAVEILTAPTTSHPSGAYSAPFDLSFGSSQSGISYIYTLDGSEPDPNNTNGTTYSYRNAYVQTPGQTAGPLLNNSYKTFNYSAPINIKDRTSEPNDISMISSTYWNDPTYLPSFNNTKCTVVKVKATKPNQVPSPTTTRTYFVGQTYTLPVISLSVSENKFFEYNNGIYVAGKDFDTWRALNPAAVASGVSSANYTRTGDATEQVGHMSFFVNGVEKINQTVGFRINGGISRDRHIKALRIYARDEYGNNKLPYSFFNDADYNSYSRLLLRNSGNDCYITYFRDALMHRLVRHMNLDIQDYQPVITYLNGEYWGIQNLRERYDRYYIQRKYGVDDNDVDMLEKNGAVLEGTNPNTNYVNLVNFLNANNLSNSASMDTVKTRVDTESAIDYYLTNIYIGNEDWPENNYTIWRKQTASYLPNDDFGHDGRWRFLLNDTDAGFGISGNNTSNLLEKATDPLSLNPWSTLLLRKLLENNTFKIDFINRFADMINTTYLPSRVLTRLEDMKAGITPEMAKHIQRWERPETLAEWESQINLMRNFANERPDIQRTHIRTKFAIASNLNVTLNVSDPAHGIVKINTIEIDSTTVGVPDNPYPWTGVYFHNIPITLKAIARDGYYFSHWSGDSNSTDSQISITPTESKSFTANFLPIAINTTTPLYFWVLDTLVPNNQPLQSLPAHFKQAGLPNASISYESALLGYPFTSVHPSWRTASFERRNLPTAFNYRPAGNNGKPYLEAALRAAQVTQPFQGSAGQNTLVFNMPTPEYKKIQFSFAAIDEGAAESILVDYSTTATPSWTTAGLATTTMPLSADYKLFTIDFENISAANNNPNFSVRLRFQGSNMTVNNGNRVTFNNFSLDGDKILSNEEIVAAHQIKVSPNPTSDFIRMNSLEEIVNLSLFKTSGALLLEEHLSVGKKDHQLDISNMPSGVYFLHLQLQNGETAVVQIVKN